MNEYPNDFEKAEYFFLFFYLEIYILLVTDKLKNLERGCIEHLL